MISVITVIVIISTQGTRAPGPARRARPRLSLSGRLRAFRHGTLRSEEPAHADFDAGSFRTASKLVGNCGVQVVFGFR